MKAKPAENIVLEPTDLTLGLSAKEVARRSEAGLHNAASTKVDKSYGKIIVDNAVSVFSIVLVAIALLFGAAYIYLTNNGYPQLAHSYFGISKYGYLGPLVLSITIGIVQEIRSKHVLDKLRLSARVLIKAIRDGKEEIVPSESLVKGDLIRLSTGDSCPADGELISGEIEVDESFLTGESEAVMKKKGDTVYSGSAIISGSAIVLIREVGLNTYINVLSKKVKKIQKNRSELMRNIYRILNLNAILLFVIIAIVLTTLITKIHLYGVDDPAAFHLSQNPNPGPIVLGFDTEEGLEVWCKIIISTSAFAIGIIPTGLVLMTSITLAASVISLAREKTLVQELYSLENLSRVDTICLDKTGTLTDGTMHWDHSDYFASEEDSNEALSILLGAFDERNATAQALFATFGSKEADIESSIPFSSARKSESVQLKDGSVLALGAPDFLLGSHPEILAKVDEASEQGLRALALLRNGEPMAVYYLADQIRASAKETIAYFLENGLDIKIISGDNPKTVAAIARICGVPHTEKAISLAGLSEEEVKAVANEYVIFARVSPEQKEWLVEALQAKKKKVAMTGDGVNDILALRKANASITFSRATDAAKSCSDVVLLDDDFCHLKSVLHQGRRVVNNTERTAILFLMKTVCIASLAVFLIPFKQGQLYYTIENIYLMQTAIIAVGGFLLSMEPSKKPIQGNFIHNVYPRALSAGIYMLIGSLLPPILADTGVIPAETSACLISVLEFVAGFGVICVLCIPFNKHRSISIGLVVFTAAVICLALPRWYLAALPLSIQTFQDGTVAREFFQPWNCPSVHDTFTSWPCIWTIILYFVLGTPLFYLVNYLADRSLKKGL